MVLSHISASHKTTEKRTDFQNWLFIFVNLTVLHLSFYTLIKQGLPWCVVLYGILVRCILGIMLSVFNIMFVCIREYTYTPNTPSTSLITLWWRFGQTPIKGLYWQDVSIAGHLGHWIHQCLDINTYLLNVYWY